jgi:hypothetical protein
MHCFLAFPEISWLAAIDFCVVLVVLLPEQSPREMWPCLSLLFYLNEIKEEEELENARNILALFTSAMGILLHYCSHSALSQMNNNTKQEGDPSL